MIFNRVFFEYVTDVVIVLLKTANVLEVARAENASKVNTVSVALHDAVLRKSSKTNAHGEWLRNFFVDDLVLASEGITDLEKYSVTPGTKDFLLDFFLD